MTRNLLELLIAKLDCGNQLLVTEAQIWGGGVMRT